MIASFNKEYHEDILLNIKTNTCRYNAKKWQNYYDTCKRFGRIPKIQFYNKSPAFGGKEFCDERTIWEVKSVLLSYVTPNEARNDGFGGKSHFATTIKKIYADRLIADYGSVKRGALKHKFALISWMPQVTHTTTTSGGF